MTQKDSLWSRMGHWMDSFRRDATLPELAMRSRVTPISAVDPGPADVEPAEDKGSNRLMPWRKRDQILQQLQSGYDRILGLVESIQEHLALHNKRSDQVAELLMVLSKGVEDIPKATRQHASTLEGLTRQMEAENGRNRAVVDAVRELPRTAETQRQGMQTIAAQVQASSAVTQKLTDRLDSIGEVVKMLGDALNEQVQTLKVVQQATRHQETQMVTILDRQARRATTLTTAMFALAAILAVATGISLFT